MNDLETVEECGKTNASACLSASDDLRRNTKDSMNAWCAFWQPEIKKVVRGETRGSKRDNRDDLEQEAMIVVLEIGNSIAKGADIDNPYSYTLTAIRRIVKNCDESERVQLDQFEPTELEWLDENAPVVCDDLAIVEWRDELDKICDTDLSRDVLAGMLDGKTVLEMADELGRCRNSISEERRRIRHCVDSRLIADGVTSPPPTTSKKTPKRSRRVKKRSINQAV